jgi:hypothetical protein
MPKYQKGQSGNPKGRPRRAFSYAAELRGRLAEVDLRDKAQRTHGEMIVAKVVELAKKGSIRAMTEIVDRTEGKALQRMDLTTNRSDGEMGALTDAELNIMQGIAERAMARSMSGTQPEPQEPMPPRVYSDEEVKVLREIAEDAASRRLPN